MQATVKIKNYLNCGLLFLVFVIPLLFDPYCFDSFELPKITLLKVILILLVGIGGIYYCFLTAEEKKEFNYPLIFSFSMFIFLISFIISFLFSQDKIASLFGTYKRDEGFITILFYFLLYLITARFFIKNYFKILAVLIFTSAFLTSFYALLQHFGFDPLTKQQWERAFSTLNHPNFLAAFLAMSFPFIFYVVLLAFKNTDYSEIIFYISLILAIVIFTALLFTYSRAGWIAFTFSSTLFFVLIKNQCKEKIFFRKIIITLISFLVIFILVSFKSKKAENFTLTQRAISTFNTQDKTAISRFSMWRSSLHLIRNYPLVGCGVDAYRLLFPQFKEKNYTRYEDLHITADKAHNEFLHYASTLGFLGVFGYLFVFTTFLFLIKKFLVSSTENIEIKVVLSAIFAYYLQAVFGFSVIAIGSFLFFLFGILEALYKKSKRINIKVSNKKEKTRQFKKQEIRKKNNPLKLPILFVIIYLIFALVNFYNIYKSYAAERYFSKGSILFNARQFVDANYYLEKAVDYNPFMEDYFIKLGENYEEIGKQDYKYLELARRAYVGARDLHPLNAYNYSKIAKAVVLLSKKDKDVELLEAALNLVKQAYQLDPYNPVFLNNIGAILNDLNRSPEAEKYLRKSLSFDENYFLAHHNLALSLSVQRKFAPALKEYMYALKLDNKNVLTLKGIVICLFNLHKYKEAYKYVEKMIELEPENEWALKTEKIISDTLNKK